MPPRNINVGFRSIPSTDRSFAGVACGMTTSVESAVDDLRCSLAWRPNGRRQEQAVFIPCDRLDYSDLSSGFAPVRFRLIFLRLFIFNNMARFVFSFVFSTATCFQQLPRFVFRFVQVRFCGQLCVFNNFLGSFLKKRVFLSHLSQKARKLVLFVPSSTRRKDCEPHPVRRPSGTNKDYHTSRHSSSEIDCPGSHTVDGECLRYQRRQRRISWACEPFIPDCRRQ